MVYKIVSVESDGKKYLWGTFSRDKKKMFLFVSYLMKKFFSAFFSAFAHGVIIGFSNQFNF